MTAVEFLRNKLPIGVGFALMPWIEEAKEMEKEQIIDAYKSDRYPCSDEDAQQYYNETFNKTQNT